MSAWEKYLERQAIEAVLKKEKRERWKQRIKSWWKFKRQLPAPTTPPAAQPTTPTSAPVRKYWYDWRLWLGAVICFILVRMVVGVLYSSATSLDLKKIGWPLFWLVVVVAVVSIIAMIIKGKKWKGAATATGSALSSINWWKLARVAVVLILLILLGSWAAKAIPAWDKERQRVKAEAVQAAIDARIQKLDVIIGKEWTRPVSIPMGYSISYQSVEPIMYEVMSQSGKRDTVIPGEECQPFPGRLATASFKLTDSKSEKSATIQVRIYPSWMQRVCK